MSEHFHRGAEGSSSTAKNHEEHAAYVLGQIARDNEKSLQDAVRQTSTHHGGDGVATSSTPWTFVEYLKYFAVFGAVVSPAYAFFGLGVVGLKALGMYVFPGMLIGTVLGGAVFASLQFVKFMLRLITICIGLALVVFILMVIKELVFGS
jgi:hypothetical protein